MINGDYAIADWVQGHRGGRALLKRERNGWNSHLCGGDALKDTGSLAKAGVPEFVADKLARALAVAEAKLPSETRKKISSFQGVIKMGEHHDGHPKK